MGYFKTHGNPVGLFRFHSTVENHMIHHMTYRMTYHTIYRTSNRTVTVISVVKHRFSVVKPMYFSGTTVDFGSKNVTKRF